MREFLFRKKLHCGIAVILLAVPLMVVGGLKAWADPPPAGDTGADGGGGTDEGGGAGDSGGGTDKGRDSSPPDAKDPVRRFKEWRYGYWWPIMLPESEGRAAYPDILPDWDEEGGAGDAGGEGADEDEGEPTPDERTSPPPGEPPPYVPPPVEDEPPQPPEDLLISNLIPLPTPEPGDTGTGGAGDAGGEGADEGGDSTESTPSGSLTSDDQVTTTGLPVNPVGDLTSFPTVGGDFQVFPPSGPPPVEGQGGAGDSGGDGDEGADEDGEGSEPPPSNIQIDNMAPLIRPRTPIGRETWGDYFYVDPSQDFAQGETLVHPTGPPPAEGGAGDGGGEGADEDGGAPAVLAEESPQYVLDEGGGRRRTFEYPNSERFLQRNPPPPDEGPTEPPGGAGDAGGDGADEGEGGSVPPPIEIPFSGVTLTVPRTPIRVEPLGGAGDAGGEGTDEEEPAPVSPERAKEQIEYEERLQQKAEELERLRDKSSTGKIKDIERLNRDLGVDLFFGSGIDTLLPPTAGEAGGAEMGFGAPNEAVAAPSLDPQLDTGSAVLDGASSILPNPAVLGGGQQGGGVNPPGPNVAALHNDLHANQQAALAAFQANQAAADAASHAQQAADLAAFQGGQNTAHDDLHTQMGNAHTTFHNAFAGNQGFGAQHGQFHAQEGQVHGDLHAQQAADLNAFQGGQQADENALHVQQNAALAAFQGEQNTDHTKFHNANPGA